MNNNIKIARQLVAMAKTLVASESIGEAFYHVMDDSPSQISVVFHIDTTDTDRQMGWFDANLSRPAELDKIAEGHGYAGAKGTVDTKIHLEGLVFTLCYEGSEECDAEGFIDEIAGAYNAKEIK